MVFRGATRIKTLLFLHKFLFNRSACFFFFAAIWLPIHLQTSTRTSYRRTEIRVRLRCLRILRWWLVCENLFFHSILRDLYIVSSSFWLSRLRSTLCASHKIWCKFNIQEFTGKIEWGEGGLSKISITYCFFLNLNLQMCHWRHCLVALTVRRSVPGEMRFNVDFVSFGIQKLFCFSLQQFFERTQIFCCRVVVTCFGEENVFVCVYHAYCSSNHLSDTKILVK